MKRKQAPKERQLNKIMLQYAKLEPDKELANDWMLEKRYQNKNKNQNKDNNEKKEGRERSRSRNYYYHINVGTNDIRKSLYRLSLESDRYQLSDVVSTGQPFPQMKFNKFGFCVCRRRCFFNADKKGCVGSKSRYPSYSDGAFRVCNNFLN